MDAMRTSRSLRIGTGTCRLLELGVEVDRRRDAGRSEPADDAIAQDALRFFDAALEIANRVEPRDVDTQRDERLRDVRRETGDDDDRSHEACRRDGLEKMVRHLGV